MKIHSAHWRYYVHLSYILVHHLLDGGFVPGVYVEGSRIQLGVSGKAYLLSVFSCCDYMDKLVPDHAV